jgi:hypothetical protein
VTYRIDRSRSHNVYKAKIKEGMLTWLSRHGGFPHVAKLVTPELKMKRLHMRF